MSQWQRGRTVVLVGSAVLAVAYGVLLPDLRLLTGPTRLAGVVGVILGLYTCSHPAANAIDLLFNPYDRFSVPWLALNALALAVGLAVIFAGAQHIVA